MTFSLPEIVLAGQRRVTEVAPFRRRVAAEHGHQVDDDPDETADDAQCQQQPLPRGPVERGATAVHLGTERHARNSRPLRQRGQADRQLSALNLHHVLADKLVRTMEGR
jgi:hypothetical protein